MEHPIIHIAAPGGLGDCSIALNWLNAFRDIVGHDEKYALYGQYPEPLKHFCPWADSIKTVKEFEVISKTLPWSIVVTDIVMFRVQETSLIMPPSVASILQYWLNQLDIYGYLMNRFAASINLLAKVALRHGYNRYTFPFALSGMEYKRYEYPATRPAKAPRHYITINDGFAQHHTSKTVTKNYDPFLWAEFLAEFKRAYPNHKIVQIGDRRSLPLRHVDICLLGKTSFSEMCDWLAAADIHVGNDSGPVHVRALYQKPSVVLFGPSNSEYYRYPENVNVTGTECDECWWMGQPNFIPAHKWEDWNSNCFLGLDECLRMKSISPNALLAAVNKIL